MASRIDSALAASWTRRGVNVYVAEDREADRVGRALGTWPAAQLQLHRSDRALISLDPALRDRIEARQREVSIRQMVRQFMGAGPW